MSSCRSDASPWLSSDERTRLDLIQQGSLELLVQFDDFCRAHGIRYFLAGGTLLGAVRHQGFIPWDDDVDVLVFRDDYDRLVREMSANPPPGLWWESFETSPHTTHMHGKLCTLRQDIVATENPHLPINHSLGIDVFQLDVAPSGRLQRLRHRALSYFYLHLILLLFNAASPKHAWIKKVARAVCGCFFTVAIARRRYLANARRYAATDSPSVVALCGLYGYQREVFPKAWFHGTALLEFCGRQFLAPCGYHEYLLGHYGANYMQVPAHPRYDIHYHTRRTTDDAFDFTLILCTCGRPSAVETFLKHLAVARQQFRCQVIVVDQNRDDSLLPILAPYADDPGFLWLKSSVRGVSAARNLALPHARGQFVAFPDDDCYYREDTLARVAAFFQEWPNADVVLGQWAPAGESFTSAAPMEFITPRTAFYHAGSLVQFYRRAILPGEFDEQFGPGEHCRYPGAEDTDYLLRALIPPGPSTSARSVPAVAFRDPRIQLYHPPADHSNPRKAHAYGQARMALLKKHGFSLSFQLANVLYPLLALLREGPRAARYRFAMFRGRLSGLLARDPLDEQP